MPRLILGVLLLLSSVQPRDVIGDWQGTLGEGADKIRMVVKVARAGNGFTANLFSIDQSPDWGAAQPLTAIALQDEVFKFKVDAPQDLGGFEGSVDPRTSSIKGFWIQGGFRQPITFQRATPATVWKDPHAHFIKFVTVAAGVKLEVLDWGGTGRPLVLLAGLGNSAHVFDAFAAKLTDSYHVYGVTRRGFGASSAPASGYDADRLADDALAVIDSLKLKKPVVVGHSIAGQELSSIGSRHAEKIAGLVYLDAGYSYAYNDPRVAATQPAGPELAALPPVSRMILEGGKKYSRIQAPVLAIFAFGDQPDPKLGQAQADAFEKGVPGARVVRFPKAGHYVFLIEEAAVLREIRAFVATLAN